MNAAFQRYLAFGFGVVFVTTLLVIAIAFPNPTPFQYSVFRLVLALAAAGVAAMIPGFISVQLKDWVRAGGALAVFVLSYFYNPAALVVENATQQSTICNVTAGLSSDVVSRVYARAPFDPNAREQTFQPTSQEMFYEWKGVLTVDAPARAIGFELHHLQEGDRVTLQPETVGTVSDELKRWYSGFPEPGRSKADYLVRTISIPDLVPGGPVTITVRRVLQRPIDGAGQLISFENAHAANCHVSQILAPKKDDAERLRNRAVQLAGHVYRMAGESHPVPVAPDPGDVGEHEVQTTIEMRCKDQACSAMEGGHFEARMGKSPSEHERDRRTEELQSLKEELATIVGCVEGPEINPDPGQGGEMIRMCGSPIPLSPQMAQQLQAILEKHRAHLDVNVAKTP